MFCNRILTQAFLVLKILTCKLKIVNNKQRIGMKPWHWNLSVNEEWKKHSSNRRCRIPIMQTTTTGPIACKVEEQKTSEQPRRGPTTAARPQICKVESNNNKKHRMNQWKSINQWTSNVGEEQYCPNSLQTTLYQKNGRKLYCNTVVE